MYENNLLLRILYLTINIHYYNVELSANKTTYNKLN